MKRSRNKILKESQIQKLLEEVSTPESTSERDPYSDDDGEFGSDKDFVPENLDTSSEEETLLSNRIRRNLSKSNVSDSDETVAGSEEDQEGINLSNANHRSVSQQIICQTSVQALENDHQVVFQDEGSVLRPSDNGLVLPEAPDHDVQSASIHCSDRLSNEPPDVDFHGIRAETLDITTDGEEWTDTTEAIPVFDFDYLCEGLRVTMDENSSPLDLFKLSFSDELLDFLISRTNDYGKQLANTDRPHTRHSRKQNFRDVTKDEMLAFLGLCLLHGQINAPQRRKLFSYTDPLNFHPIFTHVMSGRRFDQIVRCLYVADSNAKGEKKINDFIEALTENFRRIYGPGKELSLDETLILFRGRLNFRQYIKSKKARYGIKFYVLTTADGYCLNIIMYCGKGTNDDESVKKTEQIVMKLMRPYLMKGHHVFMDNYYNDVELSQKLLNLRTHTTGTLRKNRKTNPKPLMAIKLKKGDHFWRRKKQVYVSAWQDKRPVYMITTRNHPKMVHVTNRFGHFSTKPEEVAEYNKFMSGVDRKDQMVAYYSSPQKTIRWYKKVFFHMLDISVYNAFYLHKKYFQDGKNEGFLGFREKLIKEMIGLDPSLTGRDIIRKGSIFSSRTAKSAVSEESSTEAFKGHWPEEIPSSNDAKRKFKYLNCSLCTKKKKRKETRFRCKGCQKKTPLCPGCFEEWHTMYQFQT